LDNRISLYKLEVFCRVVEAGSISRAASELYIAQPVVSGHMRSLRERMGGIDLLVRNGRAMRATEAGEVVYQWARELLNRRAEVDRTLAGLQAGTRGAAVIGATQAVGTYLVAPLLTEFRATNPEIELSLRMLDADQAVGSVRTGECDIGVVIADADPGLSDVDFELLRSEDLVLVGPADRPHPDEPMGVAELESAPFVCSPTGLPRRKIVDAEFRKLGVISRNVAIELGHPEPIKRAVAGGLGFALLVRSSVAEELASGELSEIELSGPRMAMPLWLVRRGSRRYSEAQVKVLDAIRSRLGGDPTPP
jgi:LysR family transcriptional regulator, low CO2-responsive transcriptional regulator